MPDAQSGEEPLDLAKRQPSHRQVAIVDRPALRVPRWLRVLAGVAAAVWLAAGLAGAPLQGRLADVQRNNNAAFLPASAESTRVDDELAGFGDALSLPGFVLYQREPKLTGADLRQIDATVPLLRRVPGVAAVQVLPAQLAPGGAVAIVSVPLVSQTGAATVNGQQLSATQKQVLATARAAAPAGVVVHGAGASATLAALTDAFSGLESTVLLVALAVVVVILLLVYRSPVVWIFPLVAAVLALGAAALIVYPLAKHDVLTLNGQTQGILSVLVIGAGTDYALLLVARYREALHAYPHRLDAMIAAWRGAAGAIAASAITVIAGLSCLSLGELNSDRSLGPVCAIGIACTAAVMLTVLPAFLLAGRWIFWPRIPRADQRLDLTSHGLWGWVSALIARRARFVWIAVSALLLACVAALGTLHTSGIPVVDSFTNTPDAVVGQRILDAAFGGASPVPATIIADADQASQVIDTVSRVSGVARDQGAVCVRPDAALLARLAASGASAGVPRAGCVPPRLQLPPVNGRVVIDARLDAPYDSVRAGQTIPAIRTALHRDVPAAHALVGGQTAIVYDTRAASRHDRVVIIPVVLVVIALVLAIVLRAVIAPLLLLATVGLSFLATLGVCAVAFTHLFGFTGADPSFPLYAFIFLVALGVDYNIFLMTRVRQETPGHGVRPGIRRGLAVTGGVITSAGVVLAATFAVLTVVPLVALAEVGFAVAAGVLIDTFLVRSLLLPALGYDIGPPIWWPSRLSRYPAGREPG